ncbi:MAG: NAD(P)/FAD-dependent oxidoreductase [Desulfovibrionales bacterium]|nr:NAD(P)/FAD-dependent oxidoreductase [Desulfovibrionales bacterium]
MYFPHLFTPETIGTCNLRNRIIMPLYPTKYAAESKVNDRIKAFYQVRARGGVALIVLDCPCLDYPRAYKGPQELRLDTEEYASGIAGLLDIIHAEGARAFMQLNYPKERILDKEVPGAKKKGEGWVVPLANAMSREEATEIIEVMAAGAKRAGEIGYDGVEIQASYGDLIAQLLSPLLNKRTDDMGGPVENRCRFLTRLIEETKQCAGRDFPVMVKLVCDEFVPGGLTVNEAVSMARLIEKAGADAIMANAGNKATKFVTIPGHDCAPGLLTETAARIKAAVNLPVIAIGKINTPALAEEIIASGKADFVAMARALIADPDLPNKAASGNIAGIRACTYCLEDCADKGVPGLGRACTVNPFAGFEYRWDVLPVTVKKKILIVGSGPAGIQAAVIASQRGHRVELWEKEAEPGGQLLLADKAPFKEEMSGALRYLIHSLKQSTAQARLNRPGAVEDIVNMAPDAVIVATGSHPIRPPIPGMDSGIVVDARELYAKKVLPGRKIVIIGGGDIGCETADWLAEPGREVTVVEMLPEVLGRMKDIPRARLLARLADKGVNILTDTRITKISGTMVSLEKKDGQRLRIKADQVILAVGARSKNSLVDELKGKIKEVIVIGDASQPGNLGAALRSATEVALKI